MLGSAVHRQPQSKSSRQLLKRLERFHKVSFTIAEAVGANVDPVFMFYGNANKFCELWMQGGLAACQFDENRSGQGATQASKVVHCNVGLGMGGEVAKFALHITPGRDIDQNGWVWVLIKSDTLFPVFRNAKIRIDHPLQRASSHRDSVLFLFRLRVPKGREFSSCSHVKFTKRSFPTAWGSLLSRNEF